MNHARLDIQQPDSKLTSIIRSLAAIATLLATSAHAVEFPAHFDSLGPTVQQLTLENGRQVHYIDDGDAGWHSVVFTGGLGTSVRVIRLLDFLRSMREDLSLRFITVERNGYGQTSFDPDLDMGDYAAEVQAVLRHLGIAKFSVFGISGGGPYTAKIASLNAPQLLSVHMAATAPSLGGAERCAEGGVTSDYAEIIGYPMQFFGFPPDSPAHLVEGFQDTAFEEAARAHNLRGQSADPAALEHETNLYCREPYIDTSMVKAPVYVYHGLADGILAGIDPEVWREAYPASEVTLRTYPGEGHDVQYRHLDQILLDMAGYASKTLLCIEGVEKLVPNADVEHAVTDGGTLGLCAWRRASE